MTSLSSDHGPARPAKACTTLALISRICSGVNAVPNGARPSCPLFAQTFTGNSRRHPVGTGTVQTAPVPDPTKLIEPAVRMIPGRFSRACDLRSAGTASPVPKIHLVGRLSSKRRMWKHVVVFVDVERHQPADGRDALERMEEQPLMFL
jgi:hypothetical protein